MKVALYHSNHDVRIDNRPLPVPGPGEMLVKTSACGVCVADTMEWYLSPRAPLTLGHEPTGTVVELGSGTTGFDVGDRVFVHHHVPCLICDYCRRGNFTMCSTFKTTHIQPGGFSEYFIASAMHVNRDTLVLPENVSFDTGTLIEPLACVVHAIQRAKIHAGDRVVLIGTGAMGLMFIQALKFWGVRKLVVYELLEWRQNKAREFGAEWVLAPLEDPKEDANRLKEILGSGGADKVIVAAKDLRAIQLGIHVAEKGGLVLLFATPHPNESLPVFPSHLFFNELQLVSSYSADHLDTRMALELLANGAVDGEALITHRFPLEELSQAIIQTASRQNCLKSIIKFS